MFKFLEEKDKIIIVDAIEERNYKDKDYIIK